MKHPDERETLAIKQLQQYGSKMPLLMEMEKLQLVLAHSLDQLRGVQGVTSIVDALSYTTLRTRTVTDNIAFVELLTHGETSGTGFIVRKDRDRWGLVTLADAYLSDDEIIREVEKLQELPF